LIYNLGEGPCFGHLRICVTAKIRKGETITASKYQFYRKTAQNERNSARGSHMKTDPIMNRDKGPLIM